MLDIKDYSKYIEKEEYDEVYEILDKEYNMLAKKILMEEQKDLFRHGDLSNYELKESLQLYCPFFDTCLKIDGYIFDFYYPPPLAEEEDELIFDYGDIEEKLDKEYVKSKHIDKIQYYIDTINSLEKSFEKLLGFKNQLKEKTFGELLEEFKTKILNVCDSYEEFLKEVDKINFIEFEEQKIEFVLKHRWYYVLIHQEYYEPITLSDEMLLYYLYDLKYLVECEKRL